MSPSPLHTTASRGVQRSPTEYEFQRLTIPRDFSRNVVTRMLVDHAERGDSTVAGVGRFASGKQRDKTIDHHIARAGVEGDHGVERSAGREQRDIADAADVLDGAGPSFVAEHHPIEVGDERRAVTAGGDIGWAKIGDDRCAEAGGDDAGGVGGRRRCG